MLAFHTANESPVAVDDVLATVAEDFGSRSIPMSTLTANDTDVDNSNAELHVTAVSNPVGGTVHIVGSNVVFTSALNFNGTASFDYTVSDGALTDVGTATFSVGPVNDPPVAVDDNLTSFAEDNGIRTISLGNLLANDSVGPANEDGQLLTITNVGNAVGGTVAISGSNVTFTPTLNFNGPAGFDYTVRDNGKTSGLNDFRTDVGTVSFTITPVNDPPVAVDDSLAAIAEDSGDRTIAFSDLLGNDSAGPPNESDQTLTVVIVDKPVGGAVRIAGSDVIFTPDLNFNGTASFDYTVRDNGTTSGSNDFRTDVGTVSFTITPVNDAPIAVDDSLTAIAEDSGTRTIAKSALTANDTDVDNTNAELNVTVVGNAVGGTVGIVGSNVIFTP
ncbi:MAG: tandem-95 repeat protein, partial [Rhodopirellula sp.]|nr:tandem-95 repeat protein [Rhodopirellula sp.]